MLNKYTIIGLIVGCVISGLGVASMIDSFTNPIEIRQTNDCLLYTSDAADEGLGVDLGGRRII